MQFESEAGGSAFSARPLAAGAWSGAEALKTRDFAELTPGELMQAEALLARLSWRLGRRPTRQSIRPVPDASTFVRSFART